MRPVVWVATLAIAASWSVPGLGRTVASPAGELACVQTRAFHDGDTFTCVAATATIRVRVAGIDAPETEQGFWLVSRDLLQKRAGPDTRVDCYKVDRFERQVCRVFGADGSDIALELVQTGLAWRTCKYASEQTPAERDAYATAEDTARSRGLGLWSQPDPMEPGECRALRQQRQQRQKCR